MGLHYAGPLGVPWKGIRVGSCHQMSFTSTWTDSILNYLSIESKNTKVGVLTMELYKFQAMKKISNIATPTTIEATVFHYFRT